MKKLFGCLFFLSNVAFAQEKTFSAAISDLYIPDNPGFILSDKAPTSVDRPSNPRAFGIGLLNLRNGGALDVTPFWLMNNPKFTFDKWISNKFPFIETFNISAATFKEDSASFLSVGFRSQLLRIYSKNTLTEIANAKKEIVKLLTPRLDSNDDPIDLTYADSVAAFKKLDEISEIKKKGFFTIEIAGAILGSSSNSSFKKLASERSGLWANLRWSPSIIPLNFTGVARYSWANNTSPKAGRDSSFLDLGLALNYDLRRLSLSAEYVYRKDFSVNTNYARFSFVGNYALLENIVLVASVGKNFSNVEDIITVVGVKLALSRSKLQL